MHDILAALLLLAVLAIGWIQSRRIDLVHKRISLTTKLNGLADPWRDSEETEASRVSRQEQP